MRRARAGADFAILDEDYGHANDRHADYLSANYGRADFSMEPGHARGQRRNRKDVAALAVAGISACAILVNALFLQSGQHPAPFFGERKTAPASLASSTELPAQSVDQVAAAADPSAPAMPLSDPSGTGSTIPTPLAKPDAKAAPVRMVGSELTGTVHAAQPRPPENIGSKAVLQQTQDKTKPVPAAIANAARNDPISELLAMPSANSSTKASAPAAAASSSQQQIVAVQRALSDFGYGQIKPSGVVDAPTKEAIARFERARNLPVNGDLSPRLLRELSTVTGRSLQ